MKNDEPFNPLIKSAVAPKGLEFRVALSGDRHDVARLMAERNPDQDPSVILKKTDKEIELTASNPDYRLFVAVLNSTVVGLCRYYHSDGIPKEKSRYEAPSGWYCMGLLVDSKYRRQGIARFLFQNRLKSLQERGAEVVYSMVDSTNLASIRMHEAFGFEALTKAAGFLHIKFESESGTLYRLDLNQRHSSLA